MIKPAFLKAYQHGPLLSLQEVEYRKWVLTFFAFQLLDDKRKGDVTVAALFPDGAKVMTAEVIAKDNGRIAGLEELSLFFETQEIAITPKTKDGASIKKGSVVAILTGRVDTLLENERLALDFLGRMSGIATKTAECVKIAKALGEVGIAATRKTLWGLLDKKAVYLGGGLTHRLGLWQSIMIKDNHLTALSNSGEKEPIVAALERAELSAPSNSIPLIEIEVESLSDANKAIEAFQKMRGVNAAHAILLDNFKPDQIKQVVKSLSKVNGRDKIILEASGGITESNLASFASTDVDVISMGSLTHSSRALDFSEHILK